jgi:hypothetical protein
MYRGMEGLPISVKTEIPAKKVALGSCLDFDRLDIIFARNTGTIIADDPRPAHVIPGTEAFVKKCAEATRAAALSTHMRNP